MTIQIRCALIAALLLAQITGMNVGRRAFNMVCLFLQGGADADELDDTLAPIQVSQKQSKENLKISRVPDAPIVQAASRCADLSQCNPCDALQSLLPA